jgi:prophage regulatory protein
MKLLDFNALKLEKGIDYGETQLWRLAKAGRFPKPIKIGGGRNAWVESEVDAYIKARIAERDQVAALSAPLTGSAATLTAGRAA